MVMEEIYYVYNFCCNSTPKILTTLEEFALQVFDIWKYYI